MGAVAAGKAGERPGQVLTSRFSRGVLVPDSQLGIAAFSSPTEHSRMQNALAELSRMGVSSTVALEPSKAYGRSEFLFASDSPQKRAQALHELALNPKVSAIMAARGGSGAIQMLPLLDWELLSKHPKPLIGFSDTTCLLVPLLNRCGWPTIHGPALEGAFGQAAQSAVHRQSAEHAIAYLRGEREALSEMKLARLSGSGDVSGPIIGGNLSTLTSLAGTPWQPVARGGILFLEETGERPYRIQRMLLQLQYAGVFEGLSGVLLGSFSGCEHPKGEGPAAEEVIDSIFSELKIPVFGYVPSGHCPENVVVPFGRAVTISDKGILFS